MSTLPRAGVNVVIVLNVPEPETRVMLMSVSSGMGYPPASVNVAVRVAFSEPLFSIYSEPEEKSMLI